VASKKILARTAAIRKNKIRGVLLVNRPLRFLWELCEEIGASTPEFRRGRGIAFKVAGESRPRLDPCCRGFGRQSASMKTLGCISSNELARSS